MSSFLKISLRIIVSLFLFIVLIGWFFQASWPLIVLIVVIITLIVLIYENIFCAKNRRDSIVIIISITVIVVGLSFIFLEDSTRKIFFKDAKLLSDVIQQKCCSDHRCPNRMEGWRMEKTEDHEYFVSNDNWKYGFSSRMIYRISNDGKKFRLRLRYNLNESEYFTGGVDQCGKE
jgi:hypothetical protein